MHNSYVLSHRNQKPPAKCEVSKVNDSPTATLLGSSESKSQAKFSYTVEHLWHNCLLASSYKTGQTTHSIELNKSQQSVLLGELVTILHERVIEGSHDSILR